MKFCGLFKNVKKNLTGLCFKYSYDRQNKKQSKLYKAGLATCLLAGNTDSICVHCIVCSNHGRGAPRRIKSRSGRGSRSGRPSRLFYKSGSGLGRPPRLSQFPRQFGKSRGQSRLSPIFSQKSGRVGISLTFPDFR